ncbi:MAG: protein-glutamate O-methyltransferase CheR [Zetaproteobacteria bacterium]|nr:MAG: protein-glutamate O-methyltransferase CheR [Zetaproteobacteria bacterium]
MCRRPPQPQKETPIPERHPQQEVDDASVEELELALLKEALRHRFGYDFRRYAHTSFKRRIARHMERHRIATISALQERLLHQQGWIERLVEDISVHVTEMFRDPDCYRAIRSEVLPFLRSFPLFHIWLAGCSTGEEVYSLAILLHEEGLLERARIYATDISEQALTTAREGVYDIKSIKTATANYLAAGGAGDFSRYYTAGYGRAVMDAALKRAITFSRHNLATDASFQQCALILCRNVMIYFDQELKQRVVQLMVDSLAPLGFLVVGARESARHPKLTAVDREHRIYRRCDGA